MHTVDVRIIVGSLFLFAIPFLALSFPRYLKARKLKRERRGSGLKQFIDRFTEQGVAEDLSREVYRYLQTQAPVCDFPVLPGDDLREVYGVGRLGGIPLPEAVDDLLMFCHCRQPTPEEMSEVQWPATVEQLVKLLHRYRT